MFTRLKNEKLIVFKFKKMKRSRFFLENIEEQATRAVLRCLVLWKGGGGNQVEFAHKMGVKSFHLPIKYPSMAKNALLFKFSPITLVLLRPLKQPLNPKLKIKQLATTTQQKKIEKSHDQHLNLLSSFQQILPMLLRSQEIHKVLRRMGMAIR